MMWRINRNLVESGTKRFLDESSRRFQRVDQVLRDPGTQIPCLLPQTKQIPRSVIAVTLCGELNDQYKRHE